MKSDLPSTKERILLVAGDIFGNKGFTGTTIRNIALAAKVNIAAVNYHFRDKEGLYSAVLEDVFSKGFTRFPATLERDENSPPKQRLQFFIRGMFYRLQSSEGWGGMSGQGRLIAKELLDPSPAFADILERYVKPHKELLVSIIGDVMEEAPDEKDLLPCAISIIGQCIYYSFASSVISIVSGDTIAIGKDIDKHADFVYHFSLGGIEKIKNESLTPKE